MISRMTFWSAQPDVIFLARLSPMPSISRKRSVSPHDSIGANIVVQSKAGVVKRVVPFENEDINECWISDRDRFSYEGLHGSHRLTEPMVRQSDGSWKEVGWGEALEKVAAALKASAEHGPHQVRTLLSPTSLADTCVHRVDRRKALASPG